MAGSMAKIFDDVSFPNARVRCAVNGFRSEDIAHKATAVVVERTFTISATVKGTDYRQTFDDVDMPPGTKEVVRYKDYFDVRVINNGSRSLQDIYLQQK